MRHMRLCSITAVGAITVSALMVTAPAAGADAFADGCVATHGRIAIIQAANIEQCFWQDASGDEHGKNSPLPPGPFGQFPGGPPPAVAGS
jgi:hypothetical protein